jgi:hypothetical protein
MELVFIGKITLRPLEVLLVCFLFKKKVEWDGFILIFRMEFSQLLSFFVIRSEFMGLNGTHVT